MGRSKDDELLLLGLGLVGLFVLSRSGAPAFEWGTGWTWPVPDLITPGDPASSRPTVYPAVQTQEFHPGHYGVDIGYRKGPDPDMAQYQPPHDARGPFFAPSGTPIAAARAGDVWSVRKVARGWEVVLDHGKPFATYYLHLESVEPWLAKGARVEAGVIIGKMGYDPTDHPGFRHLHFAVWRNGAGDTASVDPARAMESWARTTWRQS